MTRKCIVPGCKISYKSTNKVSLFHVPKNVELQSKWIKAIPKTGVPITPIHLVCEKHFTESDIIREYIHKDATGKIIAQVKFKCPRLTDTAVPSIFPNSEKCSMTKNDPQSENENEIEIKFECPWLTDTGPSIFPNSETCFMTKNEPQSQNEDGREVDYRESTIPTLCTNDVSQNMNSEHKCIDMDLDIEPTKISDETQNAQKDIQKDCPRDLSSSSHHGTKQSLKESFSDLFNNENCIEMPKGWSRATSSIGSKWIAFSILDIQKQGENVLPLIRKSVLVLEDGSVHISVHGKTLSLAKISLLLNRIETVLDLNNLLKKLSRFIICAGVSMLKDAQSVQSNFVFQDTFGDWRHKDCPILSEKKRCKRCERLRKSLQEKSRRVAKRNGPPKRIHCIYKNEHDKENWMAVRKRLRAEMAVTRRAKERINKLQGLISQAQMKMQTINEQSIREKCAELKLPEVQRLAVQEIITAAGKKSQKGNRYTDNWVVTCFLMIIRSSSHYRFLQKNNVLPVPSPRTIRRYLANMKAECDFDSNFFAVFQKNLAEKTPMQRHGILLLHEMSLQEPISTSSSNLTFHRFADCDEQGPKAKNTDDMADHRLVFMFKAMADNYEQPIAVFASRGPVKGPDLSKLIVKAIICLEHAGAKIHAVISDGALTDRKIWTDLGISGRINDCKPWFSHPCDESRKVFILSDTLHLIKNIRNRLFNNKTLQIDPKKPPVEWEYFRRLFQYDKQLSDKLRVCPKITIDHLILNSSTKMRVCLAVQVLSNSMAKGLDFYQKNGDTGLDNCETTIEFCQRINDMFDALNKKVPNEGVTPNSSDMEILKSSLNWLNEWERNYKANLIKENQFLDANTAEGLRVTLQAMIEMCSYMQENFQFKYLLTGKINQDGLEKSVGMVCEPTDCNDHPHNT